MHMPPFTVIGISFRVTYCDISVPARGMVCASVGGTINPVAEVGCMRGAYIHQAENPSDGASGEGQLESLISRHTDQRLWGKAAPLHVQLSLQWVNL